MPTTPRILLVDSSELLLRTLGGRLAAEGWEATPSRTVDEAVIACDEGPFHVAVMDGDLGDEDGVALAIQLLDADVVEAVVFHAATASERMKLVGTFVPKGTAPDLVVAAVRETIECLGVDGGYEVWELGIARGGDALKVRLPSLDAAVEDAALRHRETKVLHEVRRAGRPVALSRSALPMARRGTRPVLPAVRVLDKTS